MSKSKGAGVISNILLSIFYACFAWIPSFVGTSALIIKWDLKDVRSIEDAFGSIGLFLLSGTLLFAVVGIVGSVVLRKKGRYAASFAIQFLPFLSLGVAFFCFMFWVFV